MPGFSFKHNLTMLCINYPNCSKCGSSDADFQSFPYISVFKSIENSILSQS